MVSGQGRLSGLSGNLPRLWNFEGGNQYSKDLSVILGLNDFFQIRAQLSANLKSLSALPSTRDNKPNGHAVTCGVADTWVWVNE